VNLLFSVSDLGHEKADDTTTLLAATAAARGHTVFYVDLECLHFTNDALMARAYRGPEGSHSPDDFLARLRDEGTRTEIDIAAMDALLLRNEPESDLFERPWGQSLAVAVGEAAAARGVMVLNEPSGVAKAIDKLYMQLFPSEIQPRSFVSRDPEAIKEFLSAIGGKAVIKPLQGSKGRNVFMVQGPEDENLNQIIGAVRRDGYVVAQEHLPEGAEGDTRLYLLEGLPLQAGGRPAVMARRPAEGDMRANVSVGGDAAAADLDDRLLKIVDAIRQRLLDDGLFFVGIDVIGDKLVEVNGICPGALEVLQASAGVDFAGAVIAGVEEKAARRHHLAPGVERRAAG
jgi:glutathione synthase